MTFIVTVGCLGFVAGFAFGVWISVDFAKGDLAVVHARNAELNELIRRMRILHQDDNEEIPPEYPGQLYEY